jgi:hypothetical protein
MAQYKVIQDIEAEDKLIGPLTLRQFIYAAVVLVLGFIAYKLSIALKTPFIIILFLPEMAFFGLLAAPFGMDQPNEIWLLAKFKFYLKPQIRKWNQDGVGGLVTVAVPKKIEKKLTKDISPTEAKSRLESLAKILDGGNISIVSPTTTSYRAQSSAKPSDDRLFSLGVSAQDQPITDVADQDDIYSDSNILAQHINSVLGESERKIKDYQKNLVSSPTHPTSSEEVPVYSSYYKDHAPPIINRHAHKQADGRQVNTQMSMTTHSDNAKISALARDNNLSIASIKRELKGGDDANEVVISLH